MVSASVSSFPTTVGTVIKSPSARLIQSPAISFGSETQIPKCPFVENEFDVEGGLQPILDFVDLCLGEPP